jgi:hypothetical protein
MKTQPAHPQNVQGVSRRELSQAGLAAGMTLSALPLFNPAALWGAAVGQSKRSGTLHMQRV